MELNNGTLNLSSMLTGITLTSGSGNSTTTTSNLVGLGNVTGGLIGMNEGFTQLLGGTGAIGGAAVLNGTNTLTVNISAPTLPGGIQASAYVTVLNGTETGYTVTNPGSGYDAPPILSVTRTGGGGGGGLQNPYSVTGWLIEGNPVVLSEGIVNSSGAPTATINNGTATLTTSTSVTLAATRASSLMPVAAHWMCRIIRPALPRRSTDPSPVLVPYKDQRGHLGIDGLEQL